MNISPYAGKPAEPWMLVNLPKLISAYYTNIPDPSIPEQKIAFGTSGHRGSSLKNSFNEWHILAITQAICLYRKQQKTDGPLFIGIDTHALSVPAFASALEVLAANEVELIVFMLLMLPVFGPFLFISFTLVFLRTRPEQ